MICYQYRVWRYEVGERRAISNASIDANASALAPIRRRVHPAFIQAPSPRASDTLPACASDWLLAGRSSSCFKHRPVLPA